jgi:hypothetical protein
MVPDAVNMTTEAGRRRRSARQPANWVRTSDRDNTRVLSSFVHVRHAAASPSCHATSVIHRLDASRPQVTGRSQEPEDAARSIASHTTTHSTFALIVSFCWFLALFTLRLDDGSSETSGSLNYTGLQVRILWREARKPENPFARQRLDKHGLKAAIVEPDTEISIC